MVTKCVPLVKVMSIYDRASNIRRVPVPE